MCACASVSVSSFFFWLACVVYGATVPGTYTYVQCEESTHNTLRERQAGRRKTGEKRHTLFSAPVSVSVAVSRSIECPYCMDTSAQTITITCHVTSCHVTSCHAFLSRSVFSSHQAKGVSVERPLPPDVERYGAVRGASRDRAVFVEHHRRFRHVPVLQLLQLQYCTLARCSGSHRVEPPSSTCHQTAPQKETESSDEIKRRRRRGKGVSKISVAPTTCMG